MNSQFVRIGTVAKGLEEAHDKAGTPKPTRDCYYGKDGAKLPRADNPLSVDLIKLGEAMKIALSDLRKTPNKTYALCSHYDPQSCGVAFFEDSLVRTGGALRRFKTGDLEWRKHIFERMRETLAYLTDREANKIWCADQDKAHDRARAMIGGVCTSIAYMYGAVDLIDGFSDRFGLTPQEKRTLLGEMCDFFYDFSTYSSQFENFFQAIFVANFNHELGALWERFVIFQHSNIKIERDDSGTPQVLIDLHQLNAASALITRNPGIRRGCSAYFSGLLRPFLEWSKDVVGGVVFTSVDEVDALKNQ